MTEKIIPDGYKLVAVKGLDELVYWLERCKDKGHIENCADLIEPFEAFEYRNVSEEAVIAAHEAKAAPASTQDEPFGYFRAEPFGWTDCAATDEGAIALYERPAAPAVPQGWRFEKDYGSITVFTPSGGSCVLWECGHGGVETLAYQMACMLAATSAAPSQEPDVPQGFKPVGYLRSDEFDGHVFEPIDGTWPFDELLFSLSTSPEPVQEVTLTDEEIKRNWSGGACPPWGIKFARAIIAALREKGALR